MRPHSVQAHWAARPRRALELRAPERVVSRWAEHRAHPLALAAPRQPEPPLARQRQARRRELVRPVRRRASGRGRGRPAHPAS